ncbi:MAG: Mg-chelatase subunit ChlD [Bacteroidia bacterium]|jgi:Mg-chelatase subunit ChlD
MLLQLAIRRVGVIGLIILAQSAFGQQMTPGIYNFGKVKLWNNPKAELTFTNNSNKRVMFLPISYQQNLYVNLPQGYIEPGQSVKIEAIYYTESSGNFSIKQPLYLSGWGEPIYLGLKGKILTFHPDAHIACPNMGQEQKKQATSQIAQIIVKDKSSGEILNGVDVLLVGPDKNFFVERTTKKSIPLKKIGIGLYQIDVSKPGYITNKELIYINKNTQVIVIELERSPYDFDVIETIPETKEDDVVVEIEKPKESDQDAIERFRKIMDERFKGKTIIEKDVMVLKESRDSSQEVKDSIQEVVNKPSPDTTGQVVEETPKEDFSNTGELNPEKYASNNVVFLIDESSSMMINNKMDFLKISMKKAVSVLREEDRVTIIVYSKHAEVRLVSTPGDRKDIINAVIDSLTPGGRSYGAEGLAMSYRFAKQNFIPSGNNQLILATDGLFNSPDYTERDMCSMAQTHAAIGIKTTVVGFGKDKEAIAFMLKLSDNGKGRFITIKTQSEAQKALISEIMQNALR